MYPALLWHHGVTFLSSHLCLVIRLLSLVSHWLVLLAMMLFDSHNNVLTDMFGYDFREIQWTDRLRKRKFNGYDHLFIFGANLSSYSSWYLMYLLVSAVKSYSLLWFWPWTASPSGSINPFLIGWPGLFAFRGDSRFGLVTLSRISWLTRIEILWWLRGLRVRSHACIGVSSQI
jgi:hypothetical protein